jgi:hypothetical protein
MKKLQLKELLKHIIQEVKRNLSEDSVNVTDDPKLKQGTDIPMGAVNLEEVLTPALIDRAKIFAGATLRWEKDPQIAAKALRRLAFKVAKPDLRRDYELASQYVLDPKMAKTLQEMSSTGGVAGYSTPFAFSKKGSGSKRAVDVTKKMGMKVVGDTPRV